MPETQFENGTVEALLKDTIRLPSLPVIAFRMLEAVKSENFSFGQLAAIIQADPALTARVLKVANSSLYFLRSEVSSIEKALVVMGTDAVKNIALSFVIAKDLKRQAERGFDFNFFWRRAVTAAVAAKLVASLVKSRDESIFISALLQDIGIIVMYSCRTNDYLRVREEKRLTGTPIEIVEKQAFGFDHQELGYKVLKSWGLPEDIYMPIRYHHSQEAVPDKYSIQASILLLSDRISSVYHGTTSGEKFTGINSILRQRFAIDNVDVISIIDDVAKESLEIFSEFEVDPGNMKPFSQILQEANEELSSLNLSYEMLVMELKQSKERAETLAHELRDANEVLRRLAFRDSVTGLYNHGSFQEMMDKEMSRAQRFKRQFSLIMLDIDHFKKINDNFGHPCGDLVLQNISSILEATTRKSGFIARYGGEEFALIVPETDANGAKVLAERCRQAIAQMNIQAGNKTVKATASFGVTCYSHEMGGMSKTQVIEAADKALYNSKNSGRDKVSVLHLTKSAG